MEPNSNTATVIGDSRMLDDSVALDRKLLRMAIIDAKARGESYSDIARRAGLSRQRIHAILQSFSNVRTYKPKPWTRDPEGRRAATIARLEVRLAPTLASLDDACICREGETGCRNGCKRGLVRYCVKLS